MVPFSFSSSPSPSPSPPLSPSSPSPSIYPPSLLPLPLQPTMGLTPAERRRSLLILGVFWFFTGVEYAVILPSAWQFLQNLGADNKIWLSISISAFSVANFLFSPLYGRFADRYSTKTILIVSNFFELVGNILYLFANDVYTNVESRFIAGMGAAAGSAIFAYVGRVSETPLALNKNMGAIMTARAIGLILGPAFNFILIKVEWKIGNFKIDPYNSPGLLMTLIWLVCQFLVIKYFKDIPDDDAVEMKAKTTVVASDKQDDSILQQPRGEGDPLLDGDIENGVRGLSANDSVMSDGINTSGMEFEPDTPKCSEYLSLGVIALLLVQFLNMFNQTAYETFITPFTQHIFHWNQVANSIVYMLTAVLAIAVYLVISYFQPKYGISDRAEILAGVVLQLVGFIIFYVLPAESKQELWKFVLGSIVFVAGLPFVYIAPALQAKLTTMRTQGLGQGIRRSVVSAAQIIGPLWATLSGKDHGGYFWGGMIGLTGLSIIIMIVGWKSLYFRMPSFSNKKNADEEQRPLIPNSRTSSISSIHSRDGLVSDQGSIN
eukprot:m.133320 g.133320  ORF g.133320 m.133320 type:complete len:547 (-) comp15796_c0_seq8:196-1836(-)